MATADAKSVSSVRAPMSLREGCRAMMSTKRMMRMPAVSTPKEIWVESCQWWPMGGSGLFIADPRCMKAVGPSAGSPEAAAYNSTPSTSAIVCR